jgi:AraC-like DNA-binding protein
LVAHQEDAPHPAEIAIYVERYELAEGTRFEAHRHSAHQIVWTSSGVVAVEIEGRTWVLPPTLALWVPAGIEHTTIVTRAGAMRGVYVLTASFPSVWSRPTVVAASTLVRELLDALGNPSLAGPTRAHAEALLIDLLQPVTEVAISLPMPIDDRALEVASGTLEHPADSTSLAEWGRRVGASSRTLTRLFVTETGMTFQRWRTNARLRVALSALGAGASITAVAHEVGYSSPSAFVAAFRRATGQTPGAYFGALA